MAEVTPQQELDRTTVPTPKSLRFNTNNNLTLSLELKQSVD